jgi:toxin FitB
MNRQLRTRNDLVARFEGRLLPIDVQMAAVRGRLLGAAERQGKKLPVMDSLIAATEHEVRQA